MNLPLTPIRFLRYARDQFPNRTAVVCDQQRFTYDQFSERALRLCGALASIGARPNEPVAFLSTNCHRLLEAYYGVLEAGCILLPLNVRLTPADLAYILNDSGARLLFLESRFAPLVPALKKMVPTLEQMILLDGRHDVSGISPDNYEDLLSRSAPVECDFTKTDENATAELFYTSGTSDRPKGVMLTHRNIYLHALSVIVALQTSPTTIGHLSCEDIQLHTIPLFHANGWGAAHVVTLVGATHVMMHLFDPEHVFRLIQQERAQSCCLVPAMAVALVNSEARTKYDLSSLKRIIFGGAAVSPALVREVQQKLNCVCFSGYGLTETSPVLALSPLKAGLDRTADGVLEAKTGYAIPGVELRVVGADDEDIPANSQSVGEVIARGDGIMAGYWRQPDATRRALMDGWFHTGDLATIDDNNYIHIVDRQKDIIISGGENISSLEIESILGSHPAVLEAAVIPVPDPHWGEVPRAVVTLRPGSYCTEDELLGFCRSHLAHYKCPRLIDFVDSLPKNGLGKVLKYELRKKYWQMPAAV
ncbi:MAG TPA: long-chain-fatty-acid--CoA ligase [Terriglobales bacterium]|nr:long-chain-fatty-acid--CoA ligase [Terriglobales bacterium]